jgi:hypothetical protein
MVSVLAGHGNHLSTPLKYVETPRPRSKLSHLSFSGQLSPPLGTCYFLITFWHHPGSQWGPVRAEFCPVPLSHYTSLSLLLWTAIQSAIGPAPDIYPISLSHYTSLFYFGPPTHLPLARFLAYHLSFPIGQPSPLDSYITMIFLTLGSLIALMMEAARTS